METNRAGKDGCSNETIGKKRSLSPYLYIARPDHWIKNIFMFPGVVLAFILDTKSSFTVAIINVLLGLISCCLISSANYTLNEYLDSKSDRYHPLKRHRPGALYQLNKKIVFLEYFLLIFIGLSLAWLINPAFFVASVGLLIMGMLYNTPPIRTKDYPYIDVLSESINNPIRFLLGWFTIIYSIVPPASVLLAYWMGGAFLMSSKRYAEYRRINNPVQAGLYRHSFKYYTEKTLILSSFFYAFCSGFFIGVFLIKYKIELLLSMPLFAIIFTWYMSISMKKDSVAQAPELLHREPFFMCFTILSFIVVIGLSLVKLPGLQLLMKAYYIPIKFTQLN
ncbi:UbiA prenyltransferase family protein [Legionella massiliensis]|uniref:UbiA prenyltransferase family protein n=1 Tax=Legionella massiliensis TaxID=1034943 RepID=UPI001C400750|nr:UbiA prenyltransferase family protein [Legionella massiliensis]